MRSLLVVLPFLLSTGLLPAQQSALSGPLEAFIYDVPSRSLRPLLGTLGSASVGPPLLGGLTYGSVAPRQNYALAFQRDRCLLISGLGGEQTSTEIPGSFEAPEGVAWSGDGSTAVLYSRTGNWIQILAGLPSAVNPGAPLSTAPLGGTLSAVATDFHGKQIAIGMTGERGGTFQILAGSNFVPLLALQNPAVLAFAEDGGTLYAVDGAAHQLVQQNMSDLRSESWTPEGIVDPVALRSTRDAAHRDVVYVAGRNDRVLAAYDSATHQVLASVPLSFDPNVIEPLGRNSFLLGSRSTNSDTLWSFTNASQPVVYFVPAIPLREKRSR